MAAPMCTCLSYTRDSLLSMRGAASRLDRCTRKVLFSSEIWRPKYVRLTRTFGNLPLRQRIEFRVAALVWYSLISHAPAYTLLTFLPLPLAFGAPVTFARLTRASFMSHLLTPPLCRAGPSPWSAL